MAGEGRATRQELTAVNSCRADEGRAPPASPGSCGLGERPDMQGIHVPGKDPSRRSRPNFQMVSQILSGRLATEAPRGRSVDPAGAGRSRYPARPATSRRKRGSPSRAIRRPGQDLGSTVVASCKPGSDGEAQARAGRSAGGCLSSLRSWIRLAEGWREAGLIERPKAERRPSAKFSRPRRSVPIPRRTSRPSAPEAFRGQENRTYPQALVLYQC